MVTSLAVHRDSQMPQQIVEDFQHRRPCRTMRNDMCKQTDNWKGSDKVMSQTWKTPTFTARHKINVIINRQGCAFQSLKRKEKKAQYMCIYNIATNTEQNGSTWKIKPCTLVKLYVMYTQHKTLHACETSGDVYTALPLSLCNIHFFYICLFSPEM